MATPAREYHTQQVHYLRKQVAYNSTATHSVTRHSMGVIPSGAQIVYCLGTVKTAFSSAGTRVLTVGSNGTTANNILTTITEETATAVMPLIGAKLTFSADTEVFVKLTTAGTAAAAGLAEFVLGYVPEDNT
jgi:hypothetical protein